MHINSLNIPEGRIAGLKTLTASKLGKVVILAGKNGAGKSRLLRYLSNLGPLGSLSSGEVSVIPAIASPNNPVIHFVPHNSGLANPLQQVRTDLDARAKAVSETLGLNGINQNAPSYIQRLQNRYWGATHPITNASSADRESAISSYESLQVIIKSLLGKELTRSLNDEVLLFGQSIGSGSLSDGQSILLQFCVAIHAQAGRLSDLIVMMDEPEKHLHPAAMLEVINTVQKHLSNGQLWIATHSLPLLANFDPDSIWWMDGKTITHAGSTPREVLEGLLGDDERIERLHSFLGLPAAMAINHFTAQCLGEPEAVMTGKNDLQLKQIRDALEALTVKHQRKLRVLDIGAGRGRLISALAECMNDDKHNIDYVAFDLSLKHQEECQNAIARYYKEDSEQRWFGNQQDLKAAHSRGSMDVVILCNVLHEISPNKWLSGFFGQHGIVRHFLEDNGFLLVVEDTEMRVGEKAHEKGFLVLNRGNLKTLFEVNQTDTEFSSASAQNGRLIATLIPAQCICRARHETLIAALEEVGSEASRQIEAIRSEPSITYKQGRRLAFYLQQFANATLSIQSMGR